MKKQLFPKEFINASLEHYTFRIRKGVMWTLDYMKKEEQR